MTYKRVSALDKEPHLTKSLKDYILDMVYPKTCPFCGQLPEREECICKNCKIRLPYIEGPRCMKCSKPILDMETEYCYDCRTKAHSYISGRAVWVYDDTLRRSISRYKYHGNLEYAKVYGMEITKWHGEWIKAHGDLFVPVPLHKKKQRIRGFNQAKILADVLSETLQIPVADWLLRKRETAPQKELNDTERLKNLRNAFEVKKEIFSPVDKVMLVDDIYTTGSTIEACAKVLYDAGVKEVYFISLCIGQGF